MNVNYGSFCPTATSPTRVTFAASEGQKKVLQERSDRLENLLRAGDRKAMNMDLKQIHHFLFYGLCPDLPAAIAQYRGTHGSVLQNAKRAVRVPTAGAGIQPVDHCLPPHDVASAMMKLHHSLKLPSKNCDELLRLISSLTYEFFHIHPFLDGNGHVWRAYLIGLVRQYGFAMASKWQVGLRPYGVQRSITALSAKSSKIGTNF